MASVSATSPFPAAAPAPARTPGDLALVVMARLAPVLRHDLNNLMTVLKLDLSGARARARRAALDTARVTVLLDSLHDGLARLAEAQARLVAWLDAAPAPVAVGPTLAELAELLQGACSLRGRSLGVAAHALERNAGAERHALRLLTAAAVLAIVDGAWADGGIELDADSRDARIVVVLRRVADGAARALPLAPPPRELRLLLDDVAALARDCGWSLAASADELRLTGPQG
ncbi:hypothetical protein [Derxia lacustris]|uniref:hypothetical protein n=1 Tax=Derxia lacustris TaxID=764842 RepID=UPI000A174AE2|nr:hypothetical protein [Derxia lacustris]